MPFWWWETTTLQAVPFFPREASVTLLTFSSFPYMGFYFSFEKKSP